MKVECKTGSDKDGCCMFLAQPELGGWCLFQNTPQNTDPQLDTYRMLHENSLDFMNDAYSEGGS